MKKPPKKAPLSVVSSAVAQQVRRSFDRDGSLPLTGRAPDRHPGDGRFGLGAGPPGTSPPPPVMHMPGGDLVTGLQHPAFTLVDRLYRKLPEKSFFNPGISPTRPFSFELGTFTVPANTNLWLTDYRFAVLRQSGVDPGDFMYAEEGRFSGVLGFDLTVTQKRSGDVEYELDPQPISLAREQFAPPRAATLESQDADVFDSTVFENFGATSGQGTSLLPVTPYRQGPRQGPFTIVAEEGQKVSLSCVIFKRLLTPVAAIEGQLGGFLLHTNMSRAILQRVRPD